MANNYEALLDQPFQMLCQALLTLEYPGVQCMPVGMPDGGRDAIVAGKVDQGIIVYQVKYARNPASAQDRADWVIAAVKPEIAKITAIAGRTPILKYVLMTNMPGTSHLDTGSIDRVQHFLDGNLQIPGQCLWRDDLDRRLDAHVLLKLKYPALISGDDAIALLWKLAGSGDDRQRREGAFDAYLAHHYDQDQLVRFKEVGLSSNSLFDLYVDVPAEVETDRNAAPHRELPFYEAMAEAAIIKVQNQSTGEIEQVVYRRHSMLPPMRVTGGGIVIRTSDGYTQTTIGAAELFLGSSFMEHNACIVLEGAPGQGKSTLAQFMMQVHRARLLRRTGDISKLPDYVIHYPVMLPIKLELRDVALWLRGIDPWNRRQDQQHNSPETFEAAIAGHISRYSGGVEFDVADLLETLTVMPVLIVLDALDEVADLEDRRRVVEEVSAAVTRLQQRNSAIRVLVTSRPSSILRSASFSPERFLYMTLMPIDPHLAIDYASRWARVRSLDERDSNELVSVLSRRLNSPHIAELAKNTMQLTILLWLISLRGPSLPDKRTDLYDTYFSVFMDRESEKDNVVREKRGLILKLHMYLGFYLHAKAEAERTTGRISDSDLEALIAHYLKREEQPADSLSAVSHAVDRIFALVSRVEGTWEFEVQPLQEYFAGRYLYNSAPYMVASRQCPGTKPVRFEGVAPNPYWLNVTRFFAGCFTDGELLDLCDRILALCAREPGFGRTLAVLLVQDWVFAQSVKATRVLLEGLFDQSGIRWAGVERRYSSNSPVKVPAGLTHSQPTSADRLLNIMWPVFSYGVRTQRVADAAAMLREQVPMPKLLARWLDDRPEKGTPQYGRWLDTGSLLDVVQSLSPRQVVDLAKLEPGDYAERILAILVRAGGPTTQLTTSSLIEAGRGLLNWPATHLGSMGGLICWIANPSNWITLALGTQERNTARRWLLHHIADEFRQVHMKTQPASVPVSEDVLSIVVRALNGELRGRDLVSGLQNTITWMRNAFGPTMLECEVACLSAAVPAGGERGRGARSLTDSTRSLTDRARYARSQLNKLSWWRDQLTELNSEFDRTMWALALYAWASPIVIASLVVEFESVVESLSTIRRAALVNACARTGEYARSSTTLPMTVSASLGSLTSAAAITILSGRMPTEDRVRSTMRVLGAGVHEPYVADMVWATAAGMFIKGELTPSEFVEIAVSCHAAGCSVDAGVRGASGRDLRALGSDWPRLVLDRAWDMPSDILAAAFEQLDRQGGSLRPLLDVAAEENWFNGEDWGKPLSV